MLWDERRLVLCEKITNQYGGIRRSVGVMEQPVFSAPHISPFFSSLHFSAISLPSDNIPCSPSGHNVEIHDELPPHNKKETVSITLTMDRTCRALLGLGEVFETHCKTGILFRRRNRKPNFHHL